MAEITRQTLARYAFFEQARQTSNHIEDALVPLVLPALAGKAHTVFSAEGLAHELAPLFGPSLVLSIAECLVDPLLRQGYLCREVSTEGGAIYSYSDKINELPLTDSASRAEHDLNEIMRAFTTYVEVYRPLKPLPESAEQIRGLFIDWITTVECCQILEVEFNDALQGKALNTRQLQRVPEPLRMLFSAFVSWLSRERPPLFDKVLNLAELGLVIDLVSEIRLPSRKSKRVSLTVILDSRILLELLGLYGPSSQTAVQRLVALCKNYGITAASLVHLVDEVREICYNVINSPTEYFPGSVNEAMRRYPDILDRLKKVFQAPDVHLRREGVVIYPYTQTHNVNANNFFTDADIRRFADSLPYDRAKANMAKRDAWSLAHAVRRQNGVHSSNVYEARCLVLTRSHLFAAAAKRFLQDDKMGYPGYAVVPVMELRHFSTMFMLSFGSEVGRNVIRSELVATCDRIVRVSPDLTRRIRAVLGKMNLLSEERLEAALDDPITLTAFSLATGNDPSVVTAENSAALLEVMRTAATKDEELRHRQAELALEEQHRQALEAQQIVTGHREAELAAFKTQAEQRQAEATKAQKRLSDEALGGAAFVADRIRRQVNFCWSGIIGLVICLSLGVFADMMYDFTGLASPFQVGAGLLLGFGGLYLTVSNYIPSLAPIQLKPALTRWVANRELRGKAPAELRTKVFWDLGMIPKGDPTDRPETKTGDYGTE